MLFIPRFWGVSKTFHEYTDGWELKGKWLESFPLEFFLQDTEMPF